MKLCDWILPDSDNETLTLGCAIQLFISLFLLAIRVAVSGRTVQAQELIGHLHLLDISDGVVTLSEQL